MGSYSVRWSRLESRKPLARPFGVLFRDDDGSDLGGLTVTGGDLLFYDSFRACVLEMLGEIFVEPRAASAADPQRAWLDILATLLPALAVEAILAIDVQHEHYGMQHRFAVTVAGAAAEAPVLDAATVLDYQLFQAAVAHQAGGLVRFPAVEDVEPAPARAAAWTAEVRRLLRRPVPDRPWSWG